MTQTVEFIHKIRFGRVHGVRIHDRVSQKILALAAEEQTKNMNIKASKDTPPAFDILSFQKELKSSDQIKISDKQGCRQSSIFFDCVPVFIWPGKSKRISFTKSYLATNFLRSHKNNTQFNLVLKNEHS